MKIENQVTTLEQSKRLEELGIKGHDGAQHFWVDYSTYSGHEFALSRPLLHGEESWLIVTSVSDELQQELDNGSGNACGPIYPCYNVAELGVMLPHPDNLAEIGAFVLPSEFDKSAKEKPWYTLLEEDGEVITRRLFEENTEAQARASMLVYLLETGYITAADVNERLKSS